jgi:hypothetical protein
MPNTLERMTVFSLSLSELACHPQICYQGLRDPPISFSRAPMSTVE